jgi:multiple sugar transport system permease protein
MNRPRTFLSSPPFLLPWLIGTFLLVVVPTVATFWMAFQGENGIDLSAFSRLWSSDLVRISIFNSLIFIVWAVPLRLIGAFFLALLLRPKSYAVARMAVFLPTVIPPPAWALIGLWLFNPLYGPINLFLVRLGLPPVSWLINPSATRAMFILLSFFQLGEGFIVLLIGRSLIPESLFDAARLDGAGPLARFRTITLPLMIPWLALLTGRDLLVSLQGTFTPSFVITYGGPYYSTTFLPLLVYELAFDFRDPALVSAVMLGTFSALAGLSIWLWRGVFARD